MTQSIDYLLTILVRTLLGQGVMSKDTSNALGKGQLESGGYLHKVKLYITWKEVKERHKQAVGV